LANATPHILSPVSIAFESVSSTLLYHLLPNGIQVDTLAPGAFRLQLPLALDPWQRFIPGWPTRYQAQGLPEGWAWQVNPPEDPGLRADVLTSAPLTISTFQDSLPYMDRPEDPNRDYPPGHRLPFPMALIILEGQEQMSFKLEISELGP
jgi:hypothetical protein